jgi:hypothetical protein
VSLDLEQRLRVFFASAPQTIRAIEVLEISHSAMSKTYVLSREPYIFNITDENAVVRTVEPVNFEIKKAGTEAHLDQVYEIRLDTTDIEDAFRSEVDSIPLDTTERIKCVFREYLSDDLTDVQAIAVLQVESVSYALGAAAISAVSPRYNVTSTGERYTPRDVPMLRSFL